MALCGVPVPSSWELWVTTLFSMQPSPNLLASSFLNNSKTYMLKGFPGGSVVRNLPASAGGVGTVPGLGRCPGERNGCPLQYSCLGRSYGQRNLVGYDPWGCKSWAWFSDWKQYFQTSSSDWFLSFTSEKSHVPSLWSSWDVCWWNGKDSGAWHTLPLQDYGLLLHHLYYYYYYLFMWLLWLLVATRGIFIVV